MKMLFYDVLIIGAGPAGSAAAISLARMGYRVAILDKEEFPREKLCGDFINPSNRPILRTLGVEREILCCAHQKVTAFRLSSPAEDEVECPLPSKDHEGFGLGLSRAALDHVLVRKARSDGAELLEGYKVSGLKRATRGWSIEAEGANGTESFSARILIGADGRNSRVAHRLGLTGAPPRQGRAAAFQLRLRCPGGVGGRVEIHLFPGGYGGLVGLGGDLVNLCFAVDRDRLSDYRSLDRLLELCLPENPHLKRILAVGERLGEARSTYPVYFSPRRSYGDGVLLVGDAARVSEPVTGEGIFHALKSAQLAAAAVDQAFRHGDFSAARLRGYETACRREFRLRRGVNALIRALIYRPALATPLIRFSTKRGRLLDSIVRTVCAPDGLV